MSAKNPVGDNDKVTAVVADDWEETLKRIGGTAFGATNDASNLVMRARADLHHG